jgi:branched-chain amino acid transport system permease protein
MPWEGLAERLYGPRRPGALTGVGRDLARWARADRVYVVAPLAVGVLAAVVLLGDVRTVGQAAALVYLLLAVYGLWIVVDQGGMPSLGHAAFMGVGAYAVALLRLRLGVDGVLAALLAALLCGLAGWLVGWAVARLRAAYVALGTLAFGWLVTLVAAAYLRGAGGATISLGGPMQTTVEALGLRLRFNDAGHLLLGAVLLALAMLLLRSTQLSAVGRGWALVRGSSALAASAGYDVTRVRRRAVIAGAVLAGLAGALTAQLSGVVDPSAFSPLTSMAMFAAVLVGAPAGFVGPVLGVAVTGGLPVLLSSLLGLPSDTRVQGVVVGVVTLLALLASFRTRRPARGAVAPSVAASGPVPATARAASLQVADLGFSFGGVRALSGLSMSVAPGTIHGVMGPNGSGKSTLLRCIGGALHADAGEVRLSGVRIDLLSQPERVAAGIGRTFQHATVAPGLAPVDQVRAALQRRGSAARWWQAALQTPAYRAEDNTLRGAAVALLDRVGVADIADADPDALDTGRRRRLQVAVALATGPGLLLLDEPTAGMDAAEVAAFAGVLRGLRDEGITILLVEHNIPFLMQLCDRVTVLDGGEVLADGPAAGVAADPAVRAVYLGAS